jgi:hypothetical protein
MVSQPDPETEARIQAEMDAALKLALKTGAVHASGEMAFASRILKLPTATGLALPARSVLAPEDLERHIATPTYIAQVAAALACQEDIPPPPPPATAPAYQRSRRTSPSPSRRRSRSAAPDAEASTSGDVDVDEQTKKERAAMLTIATYIAHEPGRGTTEYDYLVLPRQGRDKCAVVHESTNIMLVGGMAPNALGLHRWLREHPGWRMAHKEDLEQAIAGRSPYRINVLKAGILLSKSTSALKGYVLEASSFVALRPSSFLFFSFFLSFVWHSSNLTISNRGGSDSLRVP